jgi:DnaJ-class molecular chaperone
MKMELKLEDLMVDCNLCQGTGEIKNPKLDYNRGGIGVRIVGPLTVPCEPCNGKGVILTENGKTLLLFLQRAKTKMLLY